MVIIYFETFENYSMKTMQLQEVAVSIYVKDDYANFESELFLGPMELKRTVKLFDIPNTTATTIFLRGIFRSFHSNYGCWPLEV